MPARLRVAIIAGAAVLIAGGVLLVREFQREPADGRSPVAPIADKPGTVAVASNPSAGKAEAPPASAQPSAPKPANPVAGRTPDPHLPATVPPKSATPAALPPASAPNVATPAMAGGSVAPPATKDEREAVALDLDKVTLMLRDFRTRMGENPVGTNAEIMKATMGGNPKGARLGPPENQALNANGELVDRWGTPIFFHQMSKTSMEIRSAGPDRVLFNEDDIIAH
jgi:hypothetical protein